MYGPIDSCRKPFDKPQYPFMTKTVSKVEVRGINLTW